MHQQVDHAIAAVGIRNRASHTEIMLGPDGRCSVIEIGARLGTGHIGFLIHDALGIDPWAAWLDGRPAVTAAIRFLTSPRPRFASPRGSRRIDRGTGTVGGG